MPALYRTAALVALLATVGCSSPLAEVPEPAVDRTPTDARPVPATPANTVRVDADGHLVGKTPLELFQEKLGAGPLDGVGADFIRELDGTPAGPAFEFWLPASGMTDPAFPDRQRHEVKVYNGSDARLKAFEGETTTYRWRFRIDPSMGTTSRFCHVFQLKAVEGDDTLPVLTFTVASGEFQLRYLPSSSSEIQYLRKMPFAAVQGVWLEASVTVKHSDAGALYVRLDRLDGSSVLRYGTSNLDLWRGGAFTRPKWGIYRGYVQGMGEARVQFAAFAITKG